MRKLLKGIVDFRENLLPNYRDTFARLALGQSPDALFIACSDSRVVPNLFASTDPGDLFVIRNVGNLIPPCGSEGVSKHNCSESAALEFSLNILKVSDIVVCGHSHCGAARALLNESQYSSPNLRNWLQYGAKSLMRLRAGEILNPQLSQEDQLSQINVLQQIEHLKNYPQVRQAIDEGRVRLHAWWFEISHAEVYVFSHDHGRFVPIDRDLAERLLSQLGSRSKAKIERSRPPWQLSRPSIMQNRVPNCCFTLKKESS